MRGIGKSLDKSIGSMEKIATNLIELPTVLEPLRTLPNKQQELISALSPLGALPAQQQAILAELQKLRDDLSSYTKATKLADPVLTESD